MGWISLKHINHSKLNSVHSLAKLPSEEDRMRGCTKPALKSLTALFKLSAVDLSKLHIALSESLISRGKLCYTGLFRDKSSAELEHESTKHLNANSMQKYKNHYYYSMMSVEKYR